VKQALDGSQGGAFRLVVTDLVMPKRGRHSRTIRGCARNLSAVGSSHHGQVRGALPADGQLLGADAVLTKPISPDLLAKVAEVLKRGNCLNAALGERSCRVMIRSQCRDISLYEGSLPGEVDRETACGDRA